MRACLACHAHGGRHDHGYTALCTLGVISLVAIGDQPIAGAEIGAHGRQCDAVLKFERAELAGLLDKHLKCPDRSRHTGERWDSGCNAREAHSTVLRTVNLRTGSQHSL